MDAFLSNDQLKILDDTPKKKQAGAIIRPLDELGYSNAIKLPNLASCQLGFSTVLASA